MITIFAYPWDMIHATVSDIHGGKQITIELSESTVDNLKWIREYRAKLEKEQQLRDENKDLQELYDQYITLANLVSDLPTNK